MIVKLLTEHHLEFLRLKGGCRGSSESTLVKMSNCWKSHALAQFIYAPLISYTVMDTILFSFLSSTLCPPVSSADNLCK